MIKSRKLEPISIASRQSLEAVVADVVKLKLEHAQATAAMEREIAEVQKRHQEQLLSLSRRIESREAGVQVYCTRNRAELFTDKKSLDLLLAEIGFEFKPPHVEKIKRRDTWGKIALRLVGVVWGRKYARTPDPVLDKEKLIADRRDLSPESLREVGLEIVQDEQFFIRPKSGVAEQTVKVGA